MLVYAVLDPETLDPDTCRDYSYQDQLLVLFRALMQNAMLIVDPEAAILQELRSRLIALSTIAGCEDLVVIATDVLAKEEEGHVSTCHPRSLDSGIAFDELPRAIATACETNLISNRPEWFEAIRVSALLRSKFEIERIQYQISKPLCEFSAQELEQRIIGATRFARSLVFYDRLIGGLRNSENHFVGIAYVVKLWCQHGHFVRFDGCASVRITTILGDRVQKKSVTWLQQEVRRWERRIGIRNLRLDLDIKQMPDPITKGKLHARYLMAEPFVFIAERGFDWFRDGEIMPTSIHAIQKVRKTIAMFDAIPSL